MVKGKELTAVEAELLKAAEEVVNGAYWRGVPHRGLSLLVAITDLVGTDDGPDWTDYLPESVLSAWDEMSTEARLAAFLASSESQISEAARGG